MATEEKGPVLNLRVVRSMVYDESQLRTLARNTLIFIYSGDFDFDEGSTLTERGFGLFIDFDPQALRVRFVNIRQQTPLGPTKQHGSVRGMVTDRTSGLYLPEGTRPQQGPEVVKLELAGEDVIRLDEDFHVLDGQAYAEYMEAVAQQPPGNDGYTR